MNKFLKLPTGESVVQNLPWKWGVQGKIFIIGGLGFMFDAWDVTLNGALIPLVAAEWGLDRTTAALLGTGNLVGMALGAFLWGTIADKIGRKKAFTWTLLIFSIFTVAGALAPSFAWFVAFRFIAGVGLGGCIPVDYALVGEFTPSKQRGRVLTAMDGWWPVGAALSFFISGWVQATTGNWRLILAVMVLPALLVFWVRRSVPESPLYLVRKGQREAAAKVIDDLVARTGTPAQAYTLPEPEAAPRLSAGSWLEQLVKIWRFSPRITLVSWSLFLTILLVYYLALTWMPSILADTGMVQSTAFFMTSVMALMGLIGVVIAALLVERVGRKWLLGITGPLSAVVLVMVAVTINAPALSLFWLLVFGVVVQIAIPVLYAYVSELYPTELRGSGFGWASSFSRLGAGFGPLAFAALWPVVGLGNLFLSAGVLVLAAVILMAFLAPETKGRQLQ
ncbi:MFS transporter [Paeniglutamicibacter sp. ABSL32-1]|uniref:MFS transporter n=1 Tax=Paeniglutamicibacter quisquiliarum TaxID=2849498 RepID=UPI001C2DB3D1|nr:MFS transporter [Paeniglutamicibacter quisquiliarum]MBV1779052.1 MFS transporter [Paeniglutamicibacter quisquiliarum]